MLPFNLIFFFNPEIKKNKKKYFLSVVIPLFSTVFVIVFNKKKENEKKKNCKHKRNCLHIYNDITMLND